MINKIRDNLLRVDKPSSVETDFRCAAVLMPLILTANNAWDILLTKRAEHLKHHPGQISFPGGGYETQDKDLSETALRETHEEIGIPDSKIELIGRLPQQKTISQYNVTPYVGIVTPDYQLTIDKSEVAEVFTVPLDFVTDPTNQVLQTANYKGKPVDYYVIQYNQYYIWGATAKILVNFSRRILR